MALKRFTDFNKLKTKEKVSKKKEISNVIDNNSKNIQKSDIKGPNVQKNMTIKNLNYGKIIENCLFYNKIVHFPKNIMPSESYKLLENYNISKDKLHYIISKQPNNSISIIKYNENADINLYKFVSQVVEYYKRNEKLKNSMNYIKIVGNEKWVILKNIPILENVNLIDTILVDLTKLLK